MELGLTSVSGEAEVLQHSSAPEKRNECFSQQRHLIHLIAYKILIYDGNRAKVNLLQLKVVLKKR